MARQVLSDLLRYIKLSEGLAFLHKMPLDPNYRATIEGFLNNRAANFLGIARAVMANPAHPYAQLFEIAGCTYADLEIEVQQHGLEPTLDALLREGVYLTLDEFRCNTGIVRGGRHIPAKMADWDNAAGQGPLQVMSSGSSGGPALRTNHSLKLADLGMAGGQLFRDEFYRWDTALIVMAPILPSSHGIAACQGAARMGQTPERWFPLGGSMRQNAHYRALTAVMVTRLRLAGAKIPYPSYLQGDDFSPVAEFIARRKREGMAAAIMGMVSSVTRVAGAALDLGLDIGGTFAMVTGESLTDAKRDLIESAGIEVYPTYATSEFGGIGSPCRQMNSGNCVHVSKPSIALVSRRIQNHWGDDEEVDSLHITSLISFAPRTLINVEIGDTGVIEPATCDCTFSRMGYDLQVRDMAAFSKFRGQGNTLPAPEIIRLLEEGLARQFGGRPGDYQLLEVEGKAQTELVLRIHPRAGVASPEKVLEHFLTACRGTYGGAQPVLHWTQSKGIRVEVKEPVLAASGKFRAIRLLGAGTRTKSADAEPTLIRAAAQSESQIR